MRLWEPRKSFRYCLRLCENGNAERALRAYAVFGISVRAKLFVCYRQTVTQSSRL